MGTTEIDENAREAASQLSLGRALLADGRMAAGEGALRRAASAGNIEAMAELGQHLFLGRPPLADAVLQEAVKSIILAANGGHAGSAHLAALIAANDPSIPDHWKHALDFLVLAATQGHKLAQFELAFLAKDMEMMAALGAGDQFTPQAWQILRGAIDLPALLTPPPRHTIRETPLITVCEGFISPEMCDWIMARAKPLLKQGKGYNPQGDGPIQRTNSEVEYPFPELDMVTMVVRQRLATLIGRAQTGMEPPSVFHYMPGQEFTSHYDFLDPDKLADEIAHTGQCVATLLVYMTDDFDGGETEFSRIGLRFKGKKRGDALIFHNVDATGAPDLDTYHAGLPPTRGEKWLFSQFVRDTKQANKLPGA